MKDLRENLKGLLAALFCHVQKTKLGENNHNLALPDTFQFDRKSAEGSQMKHCLWISILGSEENRVLTKYFLLYGPVSKSFLIYRPGEIAVNFRMSRNTAMKTSDHFINLYKS